MKLSIVGMQTVGSPGDVAANLVELRAAARAAKGGGGELLITTELFLTGYNIGTKCSNSRNRICCRWCRRSHGKKVSR
jgi:predicted amidohydrolase